jgi:1-acyl-sn-glycerol-3-phosphate acyltransferase
MLDGVPQLPAVGPAGAPAGDLAGSAAERSGRTEDLARLCVDDLLDALGLGGLRLGRDALERVFMVPARRLARQILTYDRVVGESGLAAGGAWALERMARGVKVEGRENVPSEGPLLIVANHPGLADAVALFASIRREDLRVVAAERALLEVLPNTSRYLITVPETSTGRHGVVRSATRHLRAGGAVLTFPGGRIEPDPSVLPGAADALGRWSESVGLFARLVPDLTVVPVVVSGVISPIALRSPLVYVRRRRRDREWLAATLQMLTPALRIVDTRVMFGRPVRAAQTPGGDLREEVLGEARRLIERCEAR